MEDVDQLKFNKWRDSLEEKGLIDIKIVDKNKGNDENDDIIEDIENKSLIELMQEYIDNHFTEGKEIMKKLMIKIHEESLED